MAFRHEFPFIQTSNFLIAKKGNGWSHLNCTVFFRFLWHRCEKKKKKLSDQLKSCMAVYYWHKSSQSLQFRRFYRFNASPVKTQCGLLLSPFGDCFTSFKKLGRLKMILRKILMSWKKPGKTHAWFTVQIYCALKATQAHYQAHYIFTYKQRVHVLKTIQSILDCASLWF